MKTYWLLNVVATAWPLLSSPAIAQLAPDPSEVVIQRITYAGSGCPAGTVAHNISDDAKAFTLLFDSFFAEAGPDIPASGQRKNCQLTVDMHVPSGWSYTIFDVDYRGYVSLDEAVTAQHNSNYYFRGERGDVEFSSTYVGPTDEDYLATDSLQLDDVVWSDCGTRKAVNINTEIKVDNSANEDGQGLLTVDSIDGSLIHEYGIRWRPCYDFVGQGQGDFDGDGLQDLVARDPKSGHIWVWQSNTLNFEPTKFSQVNSQVTWHDFKVGDFNGDGIDDVLLRTFGHWWLGLSNGSAFTFTLAATWANVAWADTQIMDVNGDGKDDVLSRTAADFWVGISNGDTFAQTALFARWSTAVQWNDVMVGDFNGDGKDDLVARTDGHWWVGLSGGKTAVQTIHFATWSNIAWQDARVADFNGDGKADIVARTNGAFWGGLSTGAAFQTVLLAQMQGTNWQDPRIGDFNDDGRDDILVRRNGELHVGLSTGQQLTTSLFAGWHNGVNWLDLTVADFNGDGKADVCGREGQNLWVGLSSGTHFQTSRFGVR